MLAALAGYLLYGAAGALGAGAVLVNLFTPLPAAVLGMRQGPAWGAAAVALTAAAVLATSGGAATLLYAVQYGLPAALLPWLLLRGVRWDLAAVVTLGLMLALGIVVLLAVSSGSGQSAVGLIDAQIDREIDQTVTLMNDFTGEDTSPEDVEAFRQTVESMADFMRRAYPGMLIVVGAALQLITVGLLAFLVRPARFAGPSLAAWRAPELLIWVLIAAGFLTAFSTGGVQDAAINVLIVLLPVYFLQGLAVVEHLLRRRGLSPLLRGVGYLVLLLVNPLPVIVTAVGVFDLWADFRKPRLGNS